MDVAIHVATHTPRPIHPKTMAWGTSSRITLIHAGLAVTKPLIRSMVCLLSCEHAARRQCDRARRGWPRHDLSFIVAVAPTGAWQATRRRPQVIALLSRGDVLGCSVAPIREEWT